MNDKFIGALSGVALGDALGLPFETYTHQQIIRLLDQEHHGNHDGLIYRYYPIGQHGIYRENIPSELFPDLSVNSTGICSDDTILTLAIADSIQDSGGVDLNDMMIRHVGAVQQEPFGFGKGTRTSIEKIGSGVDWRDINDPSFGNGVMMKQMPFAFHEAITGEKAIDDLVCLARITHAHPISLVAAKVHHKLLVDLILSSSSSFDMQYWLQEGVKYAQACESEFGAHSQLSTLMNDIRVDASEDLGLGDMGNRYARKIGEEKNAYFNILSTIGICYAIFLREQEFRAVQHGISIGGDTDSYASILGSMVGTLHANIFPSELIEDIHPRYNDKLQQTIHSIRNV